jgi:hypothetical protein
VQYVGQRRLLADPGVLVGHVVVVLEHCAVSGLERLAIAH